MLDMIVPNKVVSLIREVGIQALTATDNQWVLLDHYGDTHIFNISGKYVGVFRGMLQGFILNGEIVPMVGQSG